MAMQTGGPFYAWDTLHNGYTISTLGTFNQRQRLPVLDYNPPLTKQQAELLADALNRREAWATVELQEHRTKRWTV